LTQYTYDAFGQRIVKTGSVTSTTLYQYSPAGELIEEAGGQGSMIADYIYADGRPVGEVAIGGNLYFIHDDQLGAPQVATNLTQGTVWAGTYQPFGSLTPSSQIAILAQDLRLPGQEPDVETGLYHNGFREYVPLLGRYTQSDPLGIASGLNTYAYVNDNPVSNTDRFGLSLSQSLAAVTGRVVNLSQESAARAPGIFTRKNRLEQSTAAEILPAPPAVPDLFDQFFPAPNLAKAP
jgi:RHS repeat-associated protein